MDIKRCLHVITIKIIVSDDYSDGENDFCRTKFNHYFVKTNPR
jgi:hypothetical protein